MNITTTDSSSVPQLPLDVFGVIFSFLEARPSYLLISKEISLMAQKHLCYRVSVRVAEDALCLLHQYPKTISRLTITQNKDLCKNVRDVLRQRSHPLSVKEVIFMKKEEKFSLLGVNDTKNCWPFCMEIAEEIGWVSRINLEKILHPKMGEICYEPLRENRVLAKTLRVGPGFGYMNLNDIFHAMRTNTSIEELELVVSGKVSSSTMTDGSFGSLLEENTTLKRLHVDVPKFIYSGRARECEALALNTSLTSLEFNEVCKDWGTDFLINVFHGVGNNTSIRHLAIDNDWIDSGYVPHIVSMISTNTSLRSLSLRKNLLTRDGFEDLLGFLRNSTQLHSLDLSGNPFGNWNGTSFNQIWYPFLESNTSLEKLVLEKVEIGSPDDAYDFLKGIAANTSLRCVHLLRGIVYAIDVETIIEALKQASSLREIHLGEFVSDSLEEGEREAFQTACHIREECARFDVPKKVFFTEKKRFLFKRQAGASEDSLTAPPNHRVGPSEDSLTAPPNHRVGPSEESLTPPPPPM